MFHRIEFRRIARQPFQGEAAALGGDEVAHGGTAVSGQAVPDDQQRPTQVSQQVLQEFDNLRRLDSSRKEFEVRSSTT